jgi:transcriptional regulator with XRE-family HTH domain
MRLNTRVFELYKGKYRSLTELARAMGISAGYIYKVRQGKRSINQKFIIGAMKVFPGYKLDDLFYLTPEGGRNEHK